MLHDKSTTADDIPVCANYAIRCDVRRPWVHPSRKRLATLRLRNDLGIQQYPEAMTGEIWPDNEHSFFAKTASPARAPS
jgi:hypothetical protein